MIDLDYSFIRLRDNFNDAKNIEESPIATIQYFDQIRLAKGEAYTQISNSPTAITFNGNYEVYLIDCSGNNVQDVTSNIFLEEFLDTNGIRQIKWEFIQTFEYYTRELALRFRNTVNNDTWYTNLFLCTDYEKEFTTRIDYWHKDILDGTNFKRADVKCSIRLAFYYRNRINESERAEYYQISTKNTVPQRNLPKFKARYLLDFTNEWTDLRLESIITASNLYVNCIRASSTTPIELEERELDSNIREGELILNRDKTDTYVPTYQIFEGLNLVSKTPEGIVNSCSLGISMTFNIPITLNTGTLTIYNANDNSVLVQFDQSQMSVTGNTLTITTDLSAITSEGFGYYVNVSSGLVSALGIDYAGIVNTTDWAFVVTAGQYEDTEYENDYLVGCNTSPVDNELVLAYNFNETSGTTVNDSSASGLNGNAVNVQINQAGLINRSYLFNDNGATNEFVDVGDDTILSFSDGVNDIPFSMTMWINPQNTFGEIINKYHSTNGYEYRLFMQSGFLAFRIHSQNTSYSFITVVDSVNVVTNDWNHIAITWDGANLRMKINNNVASFPQAENGNYTGMSNTSARVRIGQAGDDDTGANRFEGFIDALKIYKNKVLTDTEITADYNGGSGVEI